MNLELETWLLEVGHLIIQKEAYQGAAALSESERAIYWMWLIDYAVRNAGSFEPLEDRNSSALSDLLSFAQHARLRVLTDWLENAKDEEAFCRTYYQRFDEACEELKVHFQRPVQTSR